MKERVVFATLLVSLAVGSGLLSITTVFPDAAEFSGSQPVKQLVGGVLTVVTGVILIDMISMSRIGAALWWLLAIAILSLLSAVAAAGESAAMWRLAPTIFLVGFGIHYVLIRSGSSRVYQLFKKDAASSGDWYPHLFTKQEITGRLSAAGIISPGIKGRILAEIFLRLKHPGASWHENPQICFERARGRLAIREAENPMFAQNFSD